MSYLSRWAEFSTGSPAVSLDTYDMTSLVERGPAHWSVKFRLFKAVTDFGLAALMMPVVLIVGLVLLMLNPFLNRGALLFWQLRMGRYGRPFWMVKFRTMTCNGTNMREAHDDLEHHRITHLGRVLRKMRIDELPNFYNVLRGEMSLVGPRPDAYSHAETFIKAVEGYRERHTVKPGITGLAQVEMGYAEGRESTQMKSKYDNIYASRSCGRLDVYIILKTVQVVLTGFGGK